MSTGRISIVLLVLLLLGGPAAHATFPGANGDIAFGRQDDIWVVKPGDKSPVRLTNTKNRREMMPDWDAAGTRLAFSRCGRGEFSNCDIWVMDADGSGQTRLTFTSEHQETWPTWSPDGTKIAYTSNASDPFQDVWVMDADGSDQTRLTMTEGFDAFPEWSPDGTKIAFTSSRSASNDIWVMNADGSDPEHLTKGDKKIDERPDWSPDGARITFSRNGNIWVMDADGDNAKALAKSRHSLFSPTFSPNGKQVSYNRWVMDGRINVWTMRVDGSGHRQRTRGKLDFFPDWQPKP